MTAVRQPTQVASGFKSLADNHPPSKKGHQTTRKPSANKGGWREKGPAVARLPLLPERTYRFPFQEPQLCAPVHLSPRTASQPCVQTVYPCLVALAGSIPAAGIGPTKGPTRWHTRMSQSQGPSPEGLETRFESLIDWVESLEDQVEEYAKENQALREEVERLDERERELEARLNEVESNTSLLAKAKQDSLSNPEERAVACIQKLAKKADRTGADRVFLTQEEGWDAVNYDVDRTTVYGDFRKAEELLERPDVLWYKSEPQSSQKDSRLILDRTAGELPESVAGYTLRETRGGSTTREQGDRGGEAGQNDVDDPTH